MPPAKRKSQPIAKPKIIINKGLFHCQHCRNKGEQIYELIWKCKAGVNLPYGNHIVKDCQSYLKWRKRKIKKFKRKC